MAVGASGGEVVAWCAVTIGAVGKAAVGDPHLVPGCGEMAAAAVWLPGMIECYILPGCFLVTAAALPRIMVGRHVLGVTRLAVLVEGMVKADF